MRDEDLQQLLNDAANARKQGDIPTSARLYNQAYEALVSEAADYARNQPEAISDVGNERIVLTAYFTHADAYLKRDKLACAVANNLGVAFADMGDLINARKMFIEEVIDISCWWSSYFSCRSSLVLK